MIFMKHIGKHGDRKVAIVYRTLPGEEHMALVIYPDTLSRETHDAVIRLLESDVAQSADSLADAMHRSLLVNGEPMLETMHREGKLKKVQTSQIVVTPNAKSHVHLDELNKIFDGIEAGTDAADKMAELDANAGLVDPNEQKRDAEAIAAAGDDVLGDDALAASMMAQAKQMGAEGASLVAESKRMEKEAIKLNPALKPKRVTKKKVAAKKTASKA